LKLLLLLMTGLVCTGCGLHRTAVRASVPWPAAKAAGSGTLATTLESTDPRLQTALLKLAVSPTADAQRHVALEYRRLGVLDTAYEHFAAAVKLEPNDALSHDALARIWRDWGVPQRGLANALRAVAADPKSAAAANTLGTLYQALGSFDEAKRWYSRAAALDSKAWYAVNNLCYAQILTREAYAILTCKRAVEHAPGASIAQNNLALAHAASGELQQAKQWFRRAGDQPTADYNYGIVMMSEHEYRQAEAAFQAALLADPDFTLAASRARQARLAATAEETSHAGH
jgi:tetratricopeptide (TPR) repeat protein